MENVLKRGLTVWDRSLLPQDEYHERVRAVREAMAHAGLDVLVAIGDSVRPGNFAYLSGYVPPLRWMGVVLGAEAEPVLVSGGGAREVPFVRTQTWLEDLRTSASLFTGPAEVVSAVVSEIAAVGLRVGVAGAQCLEPAAERELRGALSGHRLQAADGMLERVRARKRPREVVALSRSLEVARAAARAAREAWIDGATNREALLAAERVARSGGCRDVRVLGNLHGEALSPVERPGGRRLGSLACVCAVERLGYWSQAAAVAGAPPAGAAGSVGGVTGAVRAMAQAVRPGARAGDVAEAALALLEPDARATAISYGLGAGIGLDPVEGPVIEPGSDDELVEGTVLALRALAVEDGRLCCAAQTIRVAAEGPEPLSAGGPLSDEVQQRDAAAARGAAAEGAAARGGLAVRAQSAVAGRTDSP
ncbi:MAG TPA: M24 family metallopeptidase [Solirubrobacteraceae bacterium]|nr:M24 family metallopeptidase [Solirubrobacteraceae bacterium]